MQKGTEGICVPRTTQENLALACWYSAGTVLSWSREIGDRQMPRIFSSGFVRYPFSGTSVEVSVFQYFSYIHRDGKRTVNEQRTERKSSFSKEFVRALELEE